MSNPKCHLCGQQKAGSHKNIAIDFELDEVYEEHICYQCQGLAEPDSIDTANKELQLLVEENNLSLLYE